MRRIVADEQRERGGCRKGEDRVESPRTEPGHERAADACRCQTNVQAAEEQPEQCDSERWCHDASFSPASVRASSASAPEWVNAASWRRRVCGSIVRCILPFRPITNV